MIQRHAKQAGIKTRIGNHSMRATGITDYLKNERHARKRAAHGQPRGHPHHEALRPAQDEISLDEVERINL